MPKFEATYEVESKTYAAIFHTAWHLLDMAECHELGRLLNLQAATVFFAFAIEAYLNHVGAEELSFWNEIDRISYKKKLAVLSKQLGFTQDLSKPPFQTILQLFELRNALAHGRTESIPSIKMTSETPPHHDAICYLLPMEKLTSQTIRRYHDDVQAAIEFINSARPKPDKLLWDQGLRSGKISAVG
jgi:hypothetical protein